MPSPQNHPRRCSTLISGKPGKSRSRGREGMSRQLFRQTMIAAAISSLGMSAAWGGGGNRNSEWVSVASGGPDKGLLLLKFPRQ